MTGTRSLTPLRGSAGPRRLQEPKIEPSSAVIELSSIRPYVGSPSCSKRANRISPLLHLHAKKLHHGIIRPLECAALGRERRIGVRVGIVAEAAAGADGQTAVLSILGRLIESENDVSSV